MKEAKRMSKMKTIVKRDNEKIIMAWTKNGAK